MLVRRRGAGQAAVVRARIVLAADAEPGAANMAIAARPGISRQGRDHLAAALPGAAAGGAGGAPRSGAPRQVGEEAVEAMIALTLEPQPTGATDRSMRAMARRVGMRQTMVSRVRRAFGLQPHRCGTFEPSRDPAFGDEVRDVVGLCLNPPDRALVLCADEKPRTQADQGTAPVLPMRPGQVERRSHGCVRHGTTDPSAVLDVRAGTVIGACKGRHRTVEFRAFLDPLEAAVPAGLDVHLVPENAATHETRAVHDRLLKRPRRHCTPTASAWLNRVEAWFSLLTRRCLQRGALDSTDGLEAAIHAYIDHTNAEPRPSAWAKSADDILASPQRFCQKTSNPYQ